MPKTGDLDRLGVGRMPTQIVGSRIVVFDEIASTNERALDMDTDGAVVVSDRQSAGRGRHGRTWHSMPGRGLWVTVVLMGDPAGLCFALPLAIRDALNPIVPATVKWPNDILIEGRKVCGILVEQRGATIAAGFGVNVNHEIGDFPEDVRDTATSLRIHSGRVLDRSEILREILIALDGRIVSLREGGIAKQRDEWADACGMIGRTVRVGDVTGVVEGIDNEGGLIIKRDGIREHVVFGDMVTVES